jgi:uncharacterized protein YggE
MKQIAPLLLALGASAAIFVCAAASPQQDPSQTGDDAPRRRPDGAMQPASPARAPATLTVMGEAQLDRPADELQIRLGVVTDGQDAQTAMQENSRRMNDVIVSLEEVGLTKDDYQTGQFQIQPQYSRPPRGQQPQDWKPAIMGYQVINRIIVETTKLELIGRLLEAATEAGANSIDSISFGLADHRKHRAEAIKAATQNARFDAQALAEAAGQRLVRVLSINLDHAMAEPPPPVPMMGRAVAMEAVDTPPINPGDITVRATVTIVYEIASQ